MNHPIRPLRAKHIAVAGVCVDCGRETAAVDVARVLRIDGNGRGRVVCNACSARIHAAKGPAPIPLQRLSRRDTASDGTRE